MSLKNIHIDNAKPQEKMYRLNDGDGLQLEVRPNGKKVWMHRYRHPATKKQSILTIGEYPRVTIRQARMKMMEAKGLIEQGIDPNTEKQRARMRGRGESFKDVALEWHKSQLARWSQANAGQVLACLEFDIFPYIGGRLISDLEAPDFLQVIRRAEGRGALDKALKIKQRMGAVMRYSVATGRVKYNPMPDLTGAMQAKETGKHFKALTLAQLPDFLNDLASYRSEVMRRAVQFALITFARTGSIIPAEWSEIDFENGFWNIPAEHMKMGDPHIIPLPRQALQLLEELRPFTGDSKYLFYTYHRNKPLSSNALLSVLRHMGWSDRTTIHGFRALASSTLHDAGFDHNHIEKQLAHAERNKVAGAYRYMAQYMPQRIELMQWWADFLDSQKAGEKVIPFQTRNGVLK